MGAPQPDVIHKLVALVAESDCVWIPLDLQSLQSGAVLCKALYHLINVHLALDPEKPSIGSSQYTDSNASEESNDIKPEILCKFGFPATHESCQMVSVRLQELVDGVLRQGMGVANVQGLQIVEFSFLWQMIQNPIWEKFTIS